MKHFLKNKILLLITLQLITISVFSQTIEPPSKWDNELWMGNKITFGQNKWRFSGDIQVRLKNNTQSLDHYYIEGVSSYLISKKWEIVPDFRISVKSDEVEYRPGFGIVNKQIKNNFQFVSQLKWQIDFDTKGNIENGARYAIFLNYLIHDKYIPNFVAGFFYRWKEDFTGFQYIRFGPGMAYIIDPKLIFSVNYLISTKNTGQEWIWAGIPIFQLVIKINKELKYVPAKYFNF